MIDFSKILKSEKTDFLKNYLNTGTKFKDKYGNGIYLGTKMISEQGGIEYTVEKIDGDILTLVAEENFFMIGRLTFIMRLFLILFGKLL
jgi:hypothetical protein